MLLKSFRFVKEKKPAKENIDPSPKSINSKKDRKSSSKTIDEIVKSDMEQTDSQSQASPPAGPAEGYVVVTNLPHLQKIERLGEPAAELENFSKSHNITLTEDFVNIKEPLQEENSEESKWVNISPKKDSVYSTEKIRKLLLEQKMPKENLWRETLIKGIPDEWYFLYVLL